MSVSQLQTALDNIDTAIVTLTSAATRDASATVEGTTYTKADLGKLIENREKLHRLITKAGGPVEVISEQWVP